MSTTDCKERKKYSEHDELQTAKRGRSTVSTMNYRLQREDAQ